MVPMVDDEVSLCFTFEDLGGIFYLFFLPAPPIDERYQDERDRTTDRRRDANSSRGGDRYYEYEEYNRSGSRNALERSEKDKRYPSTAQAYFQQQPQYAFDQYSYYQQQQYYENMRRTNPQAYAEFYKRYYGQMQQQQQQQAQLGGVADLSGTGTAAAATDGRESVHSGRSSANDKDR